jgi:hypothetical protein
MTRRLDRAAASPRLFAPEELALHPTGSARFRTLARKPGAPLTRAQAKEDEDDKTMKQLREWGIALAQKFNLRWKRLIPERDGVNGHYGICYEDGEIRIRLRHARTGRILKESSLVDTLCHELAHLKHLDHSVRFKRLYLKILDEARELGIYCPGANGHSSPIQLSLFGDGCGTTPIRRGHAKSVR